MLNIKSKKFFGGLAVYCGTVIGVGLFGLPYVASKVGFVPFLFFLIILGIYSVISALIYGEMVERTKGLHRLPGYAGIYLGKKFKVISVIAGIIGLSMSLLAYIVVGGGFLGELLIPIFGGTPILYALTFFLLGTTSIYFTAKTVAKIEILMLAFFFLVVFLLLYISLPYQTAVHFSTFDPRYIFLPYGIILFSLGGGSIIPEVKDLLGRKHEGLLKPVLMSSTAIVVITYIIFVISVLGITGPETSQDAFSGLHNFLDGVSPVFLTFGVLTTFTSFITLGVTLKKIYWYDLKVQHFYSWILAVSIPLLLYIFGITNFIFIIGITGAILGGFNNITFNLCYLKAKTKGNKKPSYSLGLKKPAIYTIVGLFFIGILIELTTLFFDKVS